jgi:hypothetical protein
LTAIIGNRAVGLRLSVLAGGLRRKQYERRFGMSTRKWLLTACCLLAAAAFASAASSIGTSAQKTLSRTGEKWKDGGRIVGEIIGFDGKVSVQVFDPKVINTPLSKVDVIPGMATYFTSFLKPGSYDLIIKAEGYAETKVKQVNVTKGADTLVNLEFGK